MERREEEKIKNGAVGGGGRYYDQHLKQNYKTPSAFGQSSAKFPTPAGWANMTALPPQKLRSLVASPLLGLSRQSESAGHMVRAHQRHFPTEISDTVRVSFPSRAKGKSFLTTILIFSIHLLFYVVEHKCTSLGFQKDSLPFYKYQRVT